MSLEVPSLQMMLAENQFFLLIQSWCIGWFAFTDKVSKPHLFFNRKGDISEGLRMRRAYFGYFSIQRLPPACYMFNHHMVPFKTVA